MNESKVTVATSEGPMDIHAFVHDDGRSRRLPAVILIQEAFGVNPHIKRVCRRVAELGYAVFAPEFFHRTGAGFSAGYDEFPRVKPIFAELTNARVEEDLKAACAHVSGRPDVDPSKVAVWGFCFGGWAAVLAACELPLVGAVSFYGGGLVNARPGIGFTPLLDRFGSIRCPMLLVYGAKDAGIPPADIEAVRARLKAQGKVHEIEIYPEGGHGFFCEDRPAYNEASAHAAWTRATKWLAARFA